MHGQDHLAMRSRTRPSARIGVDWTHQETTGRDDTASSGTGGSEGENKRPAMPRARAHAACSRDLAVFDSFVPSAPSYLGATPMRLPPPGSHAGRRRRHDGRPGCHHSTQSTCWKILIGHSDVELLAGGDELFRTEVMASLQAAVGMNSGTE